MRLFNDYALRCCQKFLPGVYDPSLKDAQEAHNFNLKWSKRLNKKLQNIAPDVQKSKKVYVVKVVELKYYISGLNKNLDPH